MNVKQITDKLLCSGCGTCNAVCARNAITMKKTSTMGLLYADVDINRCTDCGLCLKMCPSTNCLIDKNVVIPEKIIGNVNSCYVGRSLNENIFSNAQSGGMVTSILKELFENDYIDAAISCRMEYGDPLPTVHYGIVTCAEELMKFQKSCYTQIDIVSALREVSCYKRVAIVGLPCHIQGVSNLMRMNKYNNILYRIGLICDKTYSDLYMNAILYGVKKPNGKIRITYRQKDFIYQGKYYSYQNAPTVISNTKGGFTVIPSSKRAFLKQFFTVPKCKLCWDKLNVNADIVLGDPWRLEGKFDKDRGDSLIIVRSSSLIQILNDMVNSKKIVINPLSVEDIAKSQLVDSRVADIKDCDWDSCVREWCSMESLSREAICKKVSNEYDKHMSLMVVRRVLHKVKQMIKK